MTTIDQAKLLRDVSAIERTGAKFPPAVHRICAAVRVLIADQDGLRQHAAGLESKLHSAESCILWSEKR